MNLWVFMACVTCGFAAGNILAVKLNRKVKRVVELQICIECMKNEIVMYGAGLKEAVNYTSSTHESIFFSKLREKLFASDNDSIELSWKDVVDQSEYDDDIKQGMYRLLGVIEKYETEHIERSFDVLLRTIEKRIEEYSEKESRLGPLCRRMGLLCGMGIGILLI